ncbi:MAG TPA: T9SS type A sorting domain-containing protein, partial [Bacteroidetes bacterium]|nr:T9SS type A sorting domain-containing protein [Bacteroidota bacterium]
ALDPDPGDAVTYTVYWADNPEFTDADSVVGLTDTSYTFEPDLLLAGRHGGPLRLRAVPGEGGIDRSAAGKSGPSSREGSPGLDELPDDTVIYWTVRAQDTNTAGTWAGPAGGWSFAVYLYDPPAPFSLAAPDSGAVFDTLSVLFQWHPTSDPDPGDTIAYQFELAYDSLFTDHVIPLLNVGADTSVRIDGLEDDSRFWWRVRALDTNTSGTLSAEAWSFRTEMPEPPSSFSLTEPEDSTSIPFDEPIIVTFYWEQSIDPDPGEEVHYSLFLHATLPEVVDSLFEITEIPDEQYRVTVQEDLGLLEWTHPIQVDWWVVAISGTDSTTSNEEWTFWLEQPEAVAETPFTGIPTEFSIAGLYPNPFNPTLHIVVAVPALDRVRVEVFDLLGRRVAVIADRKMQPGYHHVIWQPAAPSGVYFIRTSTQRSGELVRKVMYLK